MRPVVVSSSAATRDLIRVLMSPLFKNVLDFPLQLKVISSPDSSKTANYSSKLKSQAKAKFFKFKKGKFKNYFVLGTNCVLLADQLIGVAGLDIVKINGIITPGSYYDCLNQEFYSRNNLVVSRKIYR
jgi:hypothetical protein